MVRYSPWLPDPATLATAYAHDPRKHPPGLEFLGRLFITLTSLWLALDVPWLLPLAALPSLSHVAHQGSHPHARDTLGYSIVAVGLASVAGLAAIVGGLAKLLVLWAFIGAFTMAAILESLFRHGSVVRDRRRRIAKGLAYLLLGMAAVGLAQSPLLFGERGDHPLTVWLLASAAGFVAAVALLRASERRLRVFDDADSWRTGFSSGAPRITLDDGAVVDASTTLAAGWTGPVVVVPLGVVGATQPYRSADRLSQLVVPGTKDALRVAVWDVRAGRYALAAALVAVTSAPLWMAIFVHWSPRHVWHE